MNEEVAVVRKNITINEAIGDSQSKLLKAKAEAETFYVYELQQAEAYKNLTTSLALSATELLEYIQVGLIRQYPSGNLVISLAADKTTATTPTTTP